MMLYIWNDITGYLAVAHANSVAEARKWLLETTDLCESGDGSCPERDKARAHILNTTPGIFIGRTAEFALRENAEIKEQIDLTERLEKRVADRDRRIAELEAALADTHRYLGWDFDPDVTLGSPHDAQMKKVYETLHGEKWSMASPLKAALAAAKREALEAAARAVRPGLRIDPKYAYNYQFPMTAARHAMEDCVDKIEKMAREVKA